MPPVITAKVIGIMDGDTIEVLYEGKPLRIRFAHVDCPEIRKGQPFAKAAKKLVSDLCFGQEVQVLNEGEFDQYGRLIAVIINNKNQNINKELVAEGLAWHYIKYSSDSAYANLEMQARKNRVGIWAEENPTPPWEWRNKKEKK
jgi:endonuclease YncB( thermonuclease family)